MELRGGRASAVVMVSMGEKLGELQWAMGKLFEFLMRCEREQGGLAMSGWRAATWRATPSSNFSLRSSRFGMFSLGKEEESEEKLWDVLESEGVE